MEGKFISCEENICCEKHKNVLLQKTRELIDLGAARFCAELHVSLNEIFSSNQDFADFELMYRTVVHTIESQRSIVVIDICALRSYLQAACTLDKVELNIRELCGGENVFSVISLGTFSKEKLVDATIHFISENHSMFFMGLTLP